MVTERILGWEAYQRLIERSLLPKTVDCPVARLLLAEALASNLSQEDEVLLASSPEDER